MAHRTERDALGEFAVPEEAYYGIQTARSLANFPISGVRMPFSLIAAIVRIKRATAAANAALGRVDRRIAEAIRSAGDEILAGQLADQFPVDVYQAGAGTSTHMNVNEVLANRAIELLGGARGDYAVVHPNDHVNRGQSTNDVFPASTRLALLSAHLPLVDAGRALARAFESKSVAFASVLKVGRTHLQDAVPMTLGQEFSGYAACLDHAIDGLDHASGALLELNLGSTAVGTGLNAGPEFTEQTIASLAADMDLPLRVPANRFRVTQSMGDVLAYSAAMRGVAIELGKIASDLRLLSMGPRAGLSEIRLPAVQPGSSIMPGKVNPSVPEMVNQVCYQVMGCDLTIAAANEAGQLELNVMMPVIAWNALHASTILRQAMRALATRTVDGLEADEARCRELLDRSTAVVTALSPRLGYALTAEVAKEAVATGRSVRDVVVARGLMPDHELDRLLSPFALTTPGEKHA